MMWEIRGRGAWKDGGRVVEGKKEGRKVRGSGVEGCRVN